MIFHHLSDTHKQFFFSIHRRSHVIKMQDCLLICSESQDASPGGKPFAWFLPFLWGRDSLETLLIGYSNGATLYKDSWIFFFFALVMFFTTGRCKIQLG